MNTSALIRQAFRAYILLIGNAVFNLVFIGATFAFLLLNFLWVIGSQSFVSPLELVKLFSLALLNQFVWMVTYHFSRKRIQEQFKTSGIEVGINGTSQVSGITSLLNNRTEEMQKEKETIIANHKGDPEKAKKDLVLLLMKHNGGKE